MSDKICCVYYEPTEHLTPCNHLVCEEVCYPRLATCPMCRAPLGNGVIAESVEEDSDFESDDSHINDANHAQCLQQQMQVMKI